MNKTIGTLLLAGLLAVLLTACVTINIYFPAAAAQEAADEIIDDVWQLKKDQEATEVKPSEATPEETLPAAETEETNATTPAAN